MKMTRAICAVIFVLFAMLSAASLFAQNAQAPAAENAAQDAGQQAVKDEAVQSEKELSMYGEVQAVNETAGSVSVQYYDYDSDEEKMADVMIDKDTKMENASGIADIKKGNWVDVTYTVVAGKNVAKSVIVEKEEATPETVPSSPTTEAPAE